MADGGLRATEILGLLDLHMVLKNDSAIAKTTAVRDVLRRAPRSLDAFARENAAAFKG